MKTLSNKYEEVEKLFIGLMVDTVKDIRDTIKGGEASPQDIRNAISLLKDNGFTMRDIPSDKDPEKMIEELNNAFPALPQIGPNGDILDVEVE